MTSDEFLKYFSATSGFNDGYRSVPIRAEKWRERFNAIRARYAEYKKLVSQGHESWEHGDPYAVADWINIFTPIEQAAWSDIRGLPFTVWPQFPVGKYFVDFAIVHKKIAIECDGAAYHNAEKDALRDADLRGMGWLVVRIPGRDCWTDDGSQIIWSLA